MDATVTGTNGTGTALSPLDSKPVLKAGMAAMVKGEERRVLLAKLAERIELVRAGARLYDAVIAKYQDVDQGVDPMRGKLQRIRNDRLQHFIMLAQFVRQLGGNPGAQTPCAGVIATVSEAILQLAANPRTTLAEALNALLATEQIDNTSWATLAKLTGDAGEHEMAGRFLRALRDGQEHLAIVKAWLANEERLECEQVLPDRLAQMVCNLQGR